MTKTAMFRSTSKLLPIEEPIINTYGRANTFSGCVLVYYMCVFLLAPYELRKLGVTESVHETEKKTQRDEPLQFTVLVSIIGIVNVDQYVGELCLKMCKIIKSFHFCTTHSN